MPPTLSFTLASLGSFAMVVLKNRFCPNMLAAAREALIFPTNFGNCEGNIGFFSFIAFSAYWNCNCNCDAIGHLTAVATECESQRRHCVAAGNVSPSSP
jgi:hypothetical protein